MKNVDIVPILDSFTDRYDVEPGGIHCVSKDCGSIKIFDGDLFVGSFSKYNGGWKFSPAQRAHSLDIGELSEIKSIMVFLNTNF